MEPEKNKTRDRRNYEIFFYARILHLLIQRNLAQHEQSTILSVHLPARQITRIGQFLQ